MMSLAVAPPATPPPQMTPVDGSPDEEEAPSMALCTSGNDDEAEAPAATEVADAFISDTADAEDSASELGSMSTGCIGKDGPMWKRLNRCSNKSRNEHM